MPAGACGMTMHGDREGSNALLRSAPGAMLEAIQGEPGPVVAVVVCGHRQRPTKQRDSYRPTEG